MPWEEKYRSMSQYAARVVVGRERTAWMYLFVEGRWGERERWCIS